MQNNHKKKIDLQPSSLDELLSDEPTDFFEIVRSPAERLFWKFGGVRAFHRACKEAGFHIEVSGLYKWLYPRSKGGTDGKIPTSKWPLILKAAKKVGILLNESDMDARYFPFPKPTRYEDQMGIYGVTATRKVKIVRGRRVKIK